MLYAIVALIVVILDQAVKFWIAGTIPFETGIIRLVPGFLSLVNIHNTGAAFSFLAGGGARIWFIGISAAFCLLVIIALATKLISKPVGRWAAVFVAAGGLGNCIDRILYGYVQDMFKLEFINFPVFNVADIFITVFCIVFILYVIFGTRDKDDEDDEGDYDEEPAEEEPAPRKERRERRARREEPAAEPAPVPVQQPRRSRSVEEPEENVRPARQVVAAPVEPKNVRPSASAASEPTIVASRKVRQSKYEQEYEQYKAAKAQRQAAAAQQAAARPAAQSRDSSDPFAEWENANARRQASVRKEASSYAPATSAKQPAASAAKSTAAKQPAAAADEFDLDSILNEF